MSEYGLADAPGTFERSRVVFEEIVADLSSGVTGGVTHAELEELLATRGWELMRQLFQDHADLRQVREERVVAVTGSDEVVRARVERGHSRV
jgi:hypothetical protein